MALVAATVANGGELMRPRLVTAITGEAGRGRSARRSGRGHRRGDAAAITAAMVAAVEGDARPAVHDRRQDPGVTTAGKSGTAELGGSGEPHSWFIGFAPAEAPRVAIAVLVEQAGRGAEVAAPIGGDLMELWLELDDDRRATAPEPRARADPTPPTARRAEDRASPGP